MTVQEIVEKIWIATGEWPLRNVTDAGVALGRWNILLVTCPY